MGPARPFVSYLLVVPVEGQDIFLPQIAQDGPRGWAMRQPAPLHVAPPAQEPQDREEEEEEGDEQPGPSSIHPHRAAELGKKWRNSREESEQRAEQIPKLLFLPFLARCGFSPS